MTKTILVEIDGVTQVIKGTFKIIIGDVDYRISESVDNKLTINKSDMKGSPLMVFPRYSNEIEIL